MRYSISLLILIITVTTAACFDDPLAETIRDENRTFRSHTVDFSLADETNANNNYTDNSDGTVLDGDTGLLWTKCSLADEGAIAVDAACSSETPVKHTWHEAKELCESLELADRKWRLPTFPELYSLVLFHSSGKAYSSPGVLNTTDFAPSFDEVVFPDMQYAIPPSDDMDSVLEDAIYTLWLDSEFYWTSSLHRNNNTNEPNAFFINFFNGFANLKSIEFNETFGVINTYFVRCVSR